MMLTPEDKRRAEEIFEIVFDIPPAERESFIDRECGTEPELAAEVRLLLAHYKAAGPDFLQSPIAEPDSLQSMETIGPYELKEVLGEGGMGVVYRAQQQSPVVRSVALKILKLGMDSREILARFEAERLSLAQLEHPNIARILDAGTTPDGRPYFVMEYVQGQAITTYCDAHRLTPRQRIDLFIKLCRGVQYAHQQGIIHRDLKPMNILVTQHDGVAEPKVIDFGVAKAVQQKLNEATLFTQQGQLIGTPEYMSPEQAQAAPVDTRTDVYSLGVVLYELLVGVLPIDAVSLRQAGYEAMMRLIREQDPPRPSTRISTLDGSSTAMANQRNIKPRHLVHALRGELDWITLKALEKKPDRRYSSVAALADDLNRHLEDEPVIARPASSWYLLRKFTRRHRTAAGLAFTISLAVFVLAVTMTVQARRIASERDRANHEANVSGQVKEFLLDLFVISDPSEARGNSISAREVLDRGAVRLDDLQDDTVRAEMAQTLAAVYHNLGLHARADSLFQQAQKIWLETKGPDHPNTLVALSELANTKRQRGHHALAESLFTVAVKGWQRLDLMDDPRSLEAIAKLANVYRVQGHYDQSDSLYTHTLFSLSETLGSDHKKVLRIQCDRAFSFRMQEKWEEAEAVYHEVLPILRRVQGDDSPQTLVAISGLGSIYSAQGRNQEAEVLLKEALEGSRRVMGTSHPNFVSSLEVLANFYFRQEDHDQAEPLYREVLAARSRMGGPHHPRTLTAMNNLAGLLLEQGKIEDAELVASEVLELRLQLQGDQHPYTQRTRFLMALIVAKRGGYDEALEHLTIAQEHGFVSSLLLIDEVQEVFEPLEGRPEFESLLEVARADQKGN